jgi:hypothetical protein
VLLGLALRCWVAMAWHGGHLSVRVRSASNSALWLPGCCPHAEQPWHWQNRLGTVHAVLLADPSLEARRAM